MTDNRLVRLGPPIAFAIALITTLIVHNRAGDETFLCEGSRCSLGSGASWFFTGITVLGPFFALAGALWTQRSERRGLRGAKGRRLIPDSEEIIEVLWIFAAGYVSYRLILDGPSIEAVDVRRPNTWLGDRIGTGTNGQPLTPSRRTWFLVGVLLSSPFAFSFGGALGREWYAYRDRKELEAV